MADPVVETVPVDRLTPHPDNVRKHNTKHIVRESLETHGQYKPLVVQRSTGFVLAGNGTLEVMKEIGWEEAEVRWVDVDDEQALQILIVDNKSSDDSGYDEAALADLLARMSDGNPTILEGTGYNELEVANLLRRVDRPEEASGFLSRYIADDGDADKVPVAVNVPGQGVLFRVSYMISGDDRDLVNETLRRVKEARGLESSAEALVAVCRDHASE